MMTPLPTHDEIARLLGLEGWSIGAHHRSRQGSEGLWVNALWVIEGDPSFDDGWAIAGVLAQTYGPAGDGPSWRRVVLAQADEFAVLALDNDPVSAALNRVELLCLSPYLYTDGISYWVRFESSALSGRFLFGNPDSPSLIALEEAALAVAEQITASSGLLARVVEIWRRYATRTSSDEPLELGFEE
jgi:hypothetical protein